MIGAKQMSSQCLPSNLSFTKVKISTKLLQPEEAITKVEYLDFSQIYSTVLPYICQRVETTFSRFLAGGDSNRKRRGKPRLKSQS
ncbi:MAG: hypothetical protein F6K18_29415, partial [Okeania sp. SIO2C2]|nr:hypothetical protein [Okeania sp. SIO2C2]